MGRTREASDDVQVIANHVAWAFDVQSPVVVIVPWGYGIVYVGAYQPTRLSPHVISPRPRLLIGRAILESTDECGLRFGIALMLLTPRHSDAGSMMAGLALLLAAILLIVLGWLGGLGPPVYLGLGCLPLLGWWLTRDSLEAMNGALRAALELYPDREGAEQYLRVVARLPGSRRWANEMLRQLQNEASRP